MLMYMNVPRFSPLQLLIAVAATSSYAAQETLPATESHIPCSLSKQTLPVGLCLPAGERNQQ